ncbi:hypothetical protein [Sneathiella chinensis]|uniref:Uncharacterized protein n=1 Tax=Sneathiella chinensis TaxID=349750 RepID=A0ABQ5U6G0_9PROT|nr:hypothetical protein [Sneathiella chinensis]GLQ07742.1 hypothetical protein GCM10007924_29630 [Sneathiella chinensis]
MFKKALLVATCLVVGTYGSIAGAAEISKDRLNSILATSPLEMATTGAWTVSAYDRLMGYIHSIQDKELRTLVLDMYQNPKTTVFKAEADRDALRIAPAAGGIGHHYYPGGLAVHLVEVIETALGWVRMFEEIHGIRTTDRDLVIAQLALHDWSKLWYNWDEKTGKVKKPEWFPKSWGGQDGIARWGWMGEHGAVVYAELMKRNAPQDVLFGAASTHFDPHWDVDVTDKDGKKQGFNAAMVEAADYAGTKAPQIDMEKRKAEWFLSNYTDGDWSYSQYVAGLSAHKWIRDVAEELGYKRDSVEANKLAWFVLSRISDFKLYSLYQNADFSDEGVKETIRDILADSSDFEVK